MSHIYFSGVYLLTFLLWRSRSVIPLHSFSAAITIGRALPSLYSAPFLSNNTKGEFHPNISTGSINSEKYLLYIPYSINGSMLFITMVGFFVVFVFQGKDICKEKKDKGITEPNKQSLKWRYFMFVLIFFFTLFVSVRALLLGNFLFSLTVESDLHLSKLSANILTVVLITSDAFSQFFSGIISRYITLRRIILLQMTFGTLACIILSFYGLSSLIVLWIFTPLHDLILGALRTTMISLVNSRFEVTGFLMATVDSGMACGKLASTWIGAAVLDRYNSHILLYIWLGFQLIITLTGGLLLAYLWKKPLRFLPADESDEESDIKDTKSLLQNNDSTDEDP